MATVDEIAPDIFRINMMTVPDEDFSTSFFVIRDEAPTLVETGFRRAFDDTREAVARVVDPATLRYLVVPHLEGDECGALNQFLAGAPHAVPVGSPICTALNLSDLADRDPLVVDGESELDLGAHRLRFLITPYVHTWESMLPYESTGGTLFCSDVFIGPEGGRAITDGDQTDAMINMYRSIGIFPSRAHLDSALDKIEAIRPQTLACHHGSVKAARIDTYLRALREHDVTGVTEWNPMLEP
ncbi:MBL fold metallo-hydrolase [Streptomyces sp. SYSU K217416]